MHTIKLNQLEGIIIICKQWFLTNKMSPISWLQLWATCKIKREKEEIWLSPMTEALTPTEKSKKQREIVLQYVSNESLQLRCQ